MDSGALAASEVRRLLSGMGLKARKRLGQNFLIDEHILDRIIEAAELTSRDVVIEVGPGLGVLTRRLAAVAGKVIAVELDDALAGYLKQIFSSSPGVVVVQGDILKVDPGSLLKEHMPGFTAATGYKVVANLPYYITSPVLRHFLEASVQPRLMVVMVQKEVGERIAAAPGEMSLLSVAIQLYSEPEVVASVPSQSFYPRPEVDSVVLRLRVGKKRAFVKDKEDFFAVVRAGFSAPRKQLRNVLSRALGITTSETGELLERAGISPERRAETLTLTEWEKLRAALAAKREVGRAGR